MPKMIWNFHLEDGKHTLEVNHGCYSGKWTSHLDGRLVDKTSSRQNFLFFDRGGEYVLDVGGHQFVVQVRPDGRGNFSYLLSIDGVWVEPEHFLSARERVTPLLNFLCILGVIGALMITALFWLSPPGVSPIEVIPPSLRCVVSPLIVVLCMLGVNGVFFKVIIDISHTPAMRHLGWWMLVLLSAVLFVLNVFFWAEGIQGPMGILPVLSLGISPWLVIIPVLHVACLIVLARHPYGMYQAVAFFSFASLLSSGFALDTQVSGIEAIGLRYSLGARLSPWVNVVQLLLATGMLQSELMQIPLDAWCARLVYLGSYHHFLELHKFAKQYDWEYTGPGGAAGRAVLLRGTLNGRSAFVSSDDQGLLLRICAVRPLWDIYLSVNNRRTVPTGGVSEVAIGFEDAKRKYREFFVYPPDGQAIKEEDIAILQGAVRSGQRFLRVTTDMWTEDDALYTYRFRIYTMKETSADISIMLDWMCKICEVMETNGMTVVSTENEMSAGQESR